MNSNGLPPHSELSHPKYRPDIDGLRAIAVLSVVIFHAFPNALKAGFIGVDIFFVISGYLISSIIFENIDRGSFSFGQFYGRRIKRIFPALTLVLLSCLVFGWFGLLEDEYKQLGKHVAAGAGFVSNFALWQESGYFDIAAETKPLLHLWSLAIEEQFYIVWPLLVWLLWKRKVLFSYVFTALLIGSFLISAYLVRVDRSAAFYFPGSRVWELLAGVILAYVAVRPTKWRASTTQRNAASCVGATLLALAFFKIDKNRPYPGSWALLPELGAFFIIFAGAKAWLNRVVLSSKLLVWVGLISFPLYLWHWPILSFMRIVESGTPAPLFRVAALALSFVLAWLTYQFVEKPIRNYGMELTDHSNTRSKLKIWTLVCLVAALGSTGWFVYQNNGMLHRQAAKADGLNSWDNLTFATPCNFVTHGANQDDWCNIGNAPSKPPTTILIGDSVGNNFAPMLHHFATHNAEPSFVFRQMGRGLCHGLPEIGYPNCKELIAATDAYIAQTPSIHTIIMAANWPLYFDGFELEKIRHVNSEQFKTAFEKRVAHYQSLGKRVIVFYAPPFGVNPRACVVRPLRMTETPTHCDINQQNAVANEGNYRPYFSVFVAKKGIATFDPFTFMCKGEFCKVADGSKIYYLDHEHFSQYGGEFLAKEAGESLKKLLKLTP